MRVIPVYHYSGLFFNGTYGLKLEPLALSRREASQNSNHAIVDVEKQHEIPTMQSWMKRSFTEFLKSIVDIEKPREISGSVEDVEKFHEILKVRRGC